MQICEYFFENACYSVTKYYLCKQNNKRSLLGRKQQSQVARSFPNRYLFSYTNKVTSLFSISCILDIILPCKKGVFTLQKYGFCFLNVVLLQFVWNVIAICSQRNGNPSAAVGVRFIVPAYIFATHFVCVWLILKACYGSFAL